MKLWHKILIGIGGFLIICVAGLIHNTVQLNRELEASKAETAELLKKVEKLEMKNDSLLFDVAVLEDSIVGLHIDIEAAKKVKTKLQERIVYVEPANDTIETFMALNELNNGIIRDLEKLVEVQNLQIENYKIVVQNDELIKQEMLLAIKRKEDQIEAYNKQLKKAKNQNTALGTTTTLAVIGILILLL